MGYCLWIFLPQPFISFKEEPEAWRLVLEGICMSDDNAWQVIDFSAKQNRMNSILRNLRAQTRSFLFSILTI